jgi:hypothetical protein
MDKMLKQPMTHTSTHKHKKKESSIIKQLMTNNTLLQLRKRHLTSMGTGWKATVY